MIIYSTCHCITSCHLLVWLKKEAFCLHSFKSVLQQLTSSEDHEISAADNISVFIVNQLQDLKAAHELWSFCAVVR